MRASIFNTITGQILRTVSAPVGMVSMQLNGLDEDWIEGDYPDDQFYISGMTPVAMPARPSEHHQFNWTTKQWFDPRTLADLKAAKNTAINNARAAANSSFFVFQGKQIAADPLSRSDIDAAHGSWLMLGGNPPPGWPGGWKTISNDYVLLPDYASWATFYGAMVATGTANFNHSQTLKAQLAAASTPAEVEAVPEW